jgi:hypothetical protein
MLQLRRFMLLLGVVAIYFMAGTLLAAFLQFISSIRIDSSWGASIEYDVFDAYMILKIGGVGGLVAGCGTWFVYMKNLR